MLLLASGEDLEQQLGTTGVELDVTRLVEAEQVEKPVAGDEAARLKNTRWQGTESEEHSSWIREADKAHF